MHYGLGNNYLHTLYLGRYEEFVLNHTRLYAQKFFSTEDEAIILVDATYPEVERPVYTTVVKGLRNIKVHGVYLHFFLKRVKDIVIIKK